MVIIFEIKKKIDEIVSDGATVMRGRSNGVTKNRIKVDKHYIMDIHCLSHRMELGMRHVLKSNISLDVKL